jgi:hypothetical protein
VEHLTSLTLRRDADRVALDTSHRHCSTAVGRLKGRAGQWGNLGSPRAVPQISLSRLPSQMCPTVRQAPRHPKALFKGLRASQLQAASPNKTGGRGTRVSDPMTAELSTFGKKRSFNLSNCIAKSSYQSHK